MTPEELVAIAEALSAQISALHDENRRLHAQLALARLALEAAKPWVPTFLKGRHAMIDHVLAGSGVPIGASVISGPQPPATARSQSPDEGEQWDGSRSPRRSQSGS